jgi:hypothetical protein
VNSGGWFNTNVKNGDYDQYQGGNTIDATNLEFALQDCQKLGKMVTKTGLMYFLLAQVLLRVRQKLIPAVGRQDPIHGTRGIPPVPLHGTLPGRLSMNTINLR